MDVAKTIRVEVAYARADQQLILELRVDQAASVEQAISASGILQRFPEIDLTNIKVGIFGKLTKLDQPLRDQDRIEIYRPLIADPKSIRKKRAEMRKGTNTKTGN
jgi:putative ubiquitin-RnfH superfamily antitoxin RatB of RatAB toxin-antitoxin module